MRGFRIAVVLLAVVSGAFVPAAAQAAFPGQNGRIAFIQETCNPQDDPPQNAVLMWTSPDGSDWDIGGNACAFTSFSSSGTRLMFDWVKEVDDIGYLHFGFVNPDLTGFSSLTFGQTYSPDADYGPDGRIVHRCSASPGICIRSDGVETQVAGGCFAGPAWSPDGSKIALRSSCPGQKGIATVPAAGGPLEMVVPGDFAGSPDWSPDGSKLVYVDSTSISAPSDLYSVNADGTGVAQLTPTAGSSEVSPAWSPDGTQIVFAISGFNGGPLYRMNADGTGATQIPFPAFGRSPDWQPLPVNNASTHVRPAGATPFRASLVPAHQPCTAPNRTHAAPLAFPSCSPPVPGSPNLTVGVGDGDPAFARSVGFIRLSVRPGVPGGADDADVVIRFSLSNVMRRSDLSEYTGDLRATTTVRLTDKQGAVSATSQDFPLSFDVPCAPTPSSSLDKSLCALTTTLDAIRPGAATEGTRANWALDQVQIFDGGPDEDAGTTSDNSLFAVQGVFIP